MTELDRTGLFTAAPVGAVNTALRQLLTLNQCPWFGDLCLALPVPLLIVNDTGHAVLANEPFSNLVETLPDADVVGALTDPDEIERLGLDRRPLTVLGEDYTILTLTVSATDRHRRALDRMFLHDLLNTAGGMQGLSHVMDDAPPEEVPTLQATVRSLAEQLVDEITTQRDLVAVTDGETAHDLRPTDSAEALRLVAARYRNHPITEGRHIVLATGSNAGYMVTEPVILGRVLGNMVKNALEASPTDATITLDCGRRDGRFWFSVHKPGEIAAAVRGRIFEASYSTKGYGRGLGLASMRTLAERHLAGDISFESNAARGTTFRISLPDGAP